MNVIEVEKVSKSFSGRKVLDGVSLSVKKGTICGLIGRNGSEKTVLMKCICGFLIPEQGTIKLRGKTMDAKKIVREIWESFWKHLDFLNKRPLSIICYI